MEILTKYSDLEILDLGTVDYEDALRVQEDLLHRRIDGDMPDTLVVLEHEPVVTLGRANGEDGTIDRDFFAKKGIPVLSTGRGGRITCHMPGQLVMYPVIDLSDKERDVSFYIDFLEKTVSNALDRLGIAAVRDKERRGVWVDGRKIAFIGIAVKKWVTYHGVAVNINNDLKPFEFMHPCGEADIRVTSAKECLGHEVSMEEVKRAFAAEFKRDLSSLQRTEVLCK